MSDAAPWANDPTVQADNSATPWKNDESVAMTKKQVQAESGGNPRAVSSTGAQGLMQIQPATGKDLNLKHPFDSEENVQAGQKYMHELLTKYNGDSRKALIAYNWGQGNVDKLGIEKAPQSAKDYADKIISERPTKAQLVGMAAQRNPVGKFLKEEASVVSGALSYAGMAVGLTGDAITRLTKLVGGANWKQSAEAGEEVYNRVQQLPGNPANLVKAGAAAVGLDDNTKFNKLMGNLQKVQDKGADWAGKKLGLSEEDTKGLEHLVQLYAIPKAVGVAGDVIGKTLERGKKPTNPKVEPSI